MSYVPQSPDLSAYRPQSPDLSGATYRPQSPDLSGLGARGYSGGGSLNTYQQQQRQYLPAAYGSNGFGGSPAAYQPTSVPSLPSQLPLLYDQPYDMPPSTRSMRLKAEDDEYLPDATPQTSRPRGRPPCSLVAPTSNGYPLAQQHDQFTAMPAPMPMKAEPSDPTLGVTLRTSFPVARIKRIMQADEEIGKVAQVTPHVVSRALELFMIKLISASADQARGANNNYAAPQISGAGGERGGKGPKRVLVQHMKRAIQADKNFDFLEEVIAKVPDAPAGRQGKKERKEESDSGEEVKPKKRGRKKKESGDDV